VPTAECEAFKHHIESPRSFVTTELSPEKVAAIAASRMDERHRGLDDLLESV
jgi:hypothetical protein